MLHLYKREAECFFLAGVTEWVYEPLEKTETTDTIQPEHVFIDGEVLGHSMLLVMDAAEAWLTSHQLTDEDAGPRKK